MENYERMTEAGDSRRPSKTEDQFTKTIEEYTSAIPSSAYLGVAVGAMVLSLFFQVTGQGKWGNFIAQWVPTWVIIRLYKLLSHPIRLSLDLKKFWVYQTPQPDPPIAYIPNACKRLLESTSFVQ